MRTKFILLSIVGFFTVFHLHAQQRASVSGRIIDAKTGLGLSGTSVYLPDLRRGTTADEKGGYQLQNIPEGRYLIEVSHLGYTSIVENIELKGNITRDFSLAPSYIENETVTVTGVSSATSTKRSPVPVNIVKKEDLFRNISTNLIDNLSRTPGVSQISTGPAISKPTIRGLGYNRVVVVNDGIRQEGQQWGDEHGIEIDEQNVNRVEILKGPASLMYGSDALAGVINIISIKAAHEGEITGNVTSAYMTNNRQRNLHAALDGNHNGFIWGAYGSYQAAADYKNKYDGYVFNSKFNEKNMGAYLGLNKGWGYSHLYISRFDQRLGLVEGDRDDATGKFLKQVNDGGTASTIIAGHSDFLSTDPFIPSQRVKHFKLATDNSFRAGKDRITLVAAYQQNQRQEFGNVLDPGQKGLWFDLGTINYNLQYHFAENKQWKTTAGINGMTQNNSNKGAEALIPEYDLFDIGAFLYTQKRWEDLTVSGGIRFDNRTIHTQELFDGINLKFAAFNKQFSNVSGSLGFSYQANKEVTLKLNLARGFRAPGIPELASNGAHEGTNRYEYGSVDLKSENSFQTDAGIEITTEHVSFTGNLFYNPIKNFIYYRKLSSVNGGDSLLMDGSNQFFAFQFDQGNAKLYGAEFNLDIHPHPLDWLHIENTFSWVRGLLNKEQDGSKNLPFIPAARLINEIKVDFFNNGKVLKNWYAKLELDNTFAQQKPFTGYNTETATPGYSLINTGVGGDILHRGNTLFTLFMGINNLGDVAYQSHLSRLKYTAENMLTGRQGVFNMGRNFSVKLDVPIRFSSK
ncbi:MAG: TonB-dependent receptor [Terrimonas sp.]|nr:TonB-dependent receptor [Terrimonas sp.]